MALTQAQQNTLYRSYIAQGMSASAAQDKVDAAVQQSVSAPAPTPTTTGGTSSSGTTTSSSTSAPVTSTPSGPIVDHTADGGRGITYIPNGDGTYRTTDYLSRPLSDRVSLPSNLSTATGTTSAPAATTSSVAPPSASLKPGDSGDQVKQLQDYLVSIGAMTQAQVNTGYGTYGPQTTAAVAALQSRLGVDNSSGVGYFGPRTISAITAATPTTTTGTTTPTSNMDALQTILNNPNLTPDQKAAISGIYSAVSTNDTDTAAKLQAAMKAATEYSDPYFKAQINLALDALDRGLNAKDGDLGFSETQLTNALKTLRESTAASEDQLSFQHQQELKQLGDKFETDLNTTRDSLAERGFTSSSKRARSEQILTDTNSGLVESSNKTFGYQTGNLDRALSSSEASTAAQIENLRRLNSEGKLDLYRTTEAAVGSDNLPTVDGLAGLGGVGGDIPHNQVKDALSFASNFVN